MCRKKLFLHLSTSFLITAFLFVCPAHSEKTPNRQVLKLTAGMAHVKGGCYEMGDIFDEGENVEKPVHNVCVDDFYIDKYEVTQKEYFEVMGENPSKFKDCSICPVENVNWFNAKDFCGKVGKRLPTEAEWEYAARSGGKNEKYAGTNKNLDDYAWKANKSVLKSHPVGGKKPNGLGIYDMSGNVAEWVADWDYGHYYGLSPQNNPLGPDMGRMKVIRGGAWTTAEYYMRNTYRDRQKPDSRIYALGFRCVMEK